MFTTIFLVFLLVDFLVFAAWDRYILSFSLLVLAAVAAFFFVPAFGDVIATLTWWDAVLYGAAYLAIGAAVAAFKWIIHVFKVGRFVSNCKADFSNYPSSAGGVPADYRKFLIHVKDRGFNRACRADEWTHFGISDYASSGSPITEEELIDRLTPKVAGYKTRISAWVFQWPFVVLALLFEDFLLKFGEWVAETIELMFGRLSKSIIRRALAK